VTDTAAQDANRIDVAYVARLARLALTPDEIRAFEPQLQQIVAYVRQMSRLDLSGIEPTSHAHPVQNVFRADVVKDSLPLEAVLANAPSHAGDQFIVPKILE